MLTKLNGYKTYICTGLALIDLGAMFLGYVDPNTGTFILTVLGFGSIAALRSALKTEIAAVVGQPSQQ